MSRNSLYNTRRVIWTNSHDFQIDKFTSHILEFVYEAGEIQIESKRSRFFGGNDQTRGNKDRGGKSKSSVGSANF